MRFWKAGLAAVTVISAGAIGLAATHAERDVRDGHQSVYSLAEEMPMARVFETWSSDSSRIGIAVRDVTSDDIAEHKLAGESGAIVTDVEDDMPADEAGVLDGDVIVEFDGERVRSARHLTRLVQETPSGRKVTAIVMRKGSRMTLTLAPEADRDSGVFTFHGFDTPRPPAPPAPPRAPRAPRPPMPPRAPEAPGVWFGDGAFAFGLGTARLGIGIETLSDQLAKYFGVEEGVLVKSVEDDSAASKAGLRAGDVITKINGRAVEDSGELFRELQEADDKVEIEIVRDKKAQTVTATLETRSRRSVRRVI
jgi:serine protease Do